VVLVGEARTRFKKALLKEGFNKIHDSGTFKDAVTKCGKLAKSGDAVLLSPACASFDMFNNYEERGKVFKKIVSNL
jgi:UDP-N-acetylmuramoylalanine--D-glutamate ligase